MPFYGRERAGLCVWFLFEGMCRLGAETAFSDTSPSVCPSICPFGNRPADSVAAGTGGCLRRSCRRLLVNPEKRITFARFVSGRRTDFQFGV